MSAPAVLSRRRRRVALLSSHLLLPASFLLPVSFAIAVASAVPAAALRPPSSEPGGGWFLARRFSGDVPAGELGFRFGEPLDTDGDGHADVAAGARFKLAHGIEQNGVATVWSGATGAKIREWDGLLANGLFGHWVMPIPDLDGDALADVVVSAPSADVGGGIHGVISARSPKTGEVIWRRIADREENLGWDLALAGDQNRDGLLDIFAGAPSGDTGHVYLLSGKDGSVLKSYTPGGVSSSFGWYVARSDDLDADGHDDLAVGAFQEEDPPGTRSCGVYLFSSATGTQLRHWRNPDGLTGFGEVVAAVSDEDGDGHGEIVIGSPRTSDQTRSLPGEVGVFSPTTGKELRHWTGKQPGELYGRMVASVGDMDGDGVDEIAIGAPWYRKDDADKTGRAEIRSGKTGNVLVEWFGDSADDWFGWHMRRAPDPDGLGRPALLVGSLRRAVGNDKAVGVIDLYVRRRAP